MAKWDHYDLYGDPKMREEAYARMNEKTMWRKLAQPLINLIPDHYKEPLWFWEV